MGKGFVYRCPKCGHEEELLTGVGFMSPLEADMERENILAGIYGPKAQAALVAYPEAPVSVERAIYQCGTCGKLESRLAVTVKAPIRVPILRFLFFSGAIAGPPCTESGAGRLWFAQLAGSRCRKRDWPLLSYGIEGGLDYEPQSGFLLLKKLFSLVM